MMATPKTVEEFDAALARVAQTSADAVRFHEADPMAWAVHSETPITTMLSELAAVEAGFRLARADCLVADFNAIERNMYGAALLAVRDLALRARAAAVDLHGRSERVFEAVYQSTLAAFLASNETLVGHVDRRLLQISAGGEG